ncbi:longevity assurance s lag1 lac1 [Trichoderma cornu-damae]|uniref:Longevity assurance s lag1 lac1 n=1 Tax=Trichoderma cornu-damae TaxID=654480 RepID=A0A9P8TVV7_9HYPO|nr:longevity assurance s lag1 lac1 [Trichoderma cornu-damae]
MDDSRCFSDPKVVPEMKLEPKGTPRPRERYASKDEHRIARRLRKRNLGPGSSSITQLLLDNQAGIVFNLVALLFLSHLIIPKSRVYTRPFFKLSHYNPATGKYAIGRDDFYYVTFFLILFTGLRDGLMNYVLSPLGRRCGISNRKDAARFAEQTWMILYYCVIWPLGIYLWCSSPYFLNMAELWTDWPSREISGTMKFYFLAQWAFWLQQVYVVNIEEQRKDYWQMLTHHIVTIALVAASYAYHFTRVGNLILIIMDIVDIVFPLAKCTKYLGYTTLCDYLFGLFVVVWLATRHVFFLMVCYSVYFDTPRIIPRTCFRGSMNNLQGPLPQPGGWSWLLEPFRDPEGLICFNRHIFIGFFTYLVALQGIMMMWSYAILKVALGVLSGKNAEDIRSDDEGEEGEGEEEEEEAEDTVDWEYSDGRAEPGYEFNPESGLLEEEAEVDDGVVRAWERRNRISPKRGGSSSGLHLPGQSDRKEFLNRIGCEKQID